MTAIVQFGGIEYRVHHCLTCYAPNSLLHVKKITEHRLEMHDRYIQKCNYSFAEWTLKDTINLPDTLLTCDHDLLRPLFGIF